MKQATQLMLLDLKESNQDFEWYPTTREIIAAMVRDYRKIKGVRHDEAAIQSLLDIGAGNGSVFDIVNELQNSEIESYAIEKALPLCKELARKAFVIGTDFMAQSLMSKRIPLTFCNPPYSEFEQWAEKIIRETCSEHVYLVIPQRWKESSDIAEALKFRQVKARIVGNYDFENAERAARAKVDLLEISFLDIAEHDYRRRNGESTQDPFELFFKQQFAEVIAEYEARSKQPKAEGYSSEANPKFTALTKADNYGEALVALYNADIDNIRRNYEAVKQLDVDLMRHLNIKPSDIMTGLKQKLDGLRHEYWHELFSHMHEVTDRLTTSRRKSILGTLEKSANVDFTLDNIHAVLLWVLANANHYIERQICEVFDSVISKANTRNYKSNKKVFIDDRWRYNQDKTERPTHVALEYRIVETWGGLRNKWGDHWELSEHGADLIRDILTIARTLGFTCCTQPHDLNYRGREDWTSGESHEFWGDVNGESCILLEAKAFKNGNLHIRMNQKFALAWNVENGRLNGWIKTPAEAVTELDDQEAAQFFSCRHVLGASSVPLLMAKAS